MKMQGIAEAASVELDGAERDSAERCMNAAQSPDSREPRSRIAGGHEGHTPASDDGKLVPSRMHFSAWP